MKSTTSNCHTQSVTSISKTQTILGSLIGTIFIKWCTTFASFSQIEQQVNQSIDQLRLTHGEDFHDAWLCLQKIITTDHLNTNFISETRLNKAYLSQHVLKQYVERELQPNLFYNSKTLTPPEADGKKWDAAVLQMQHFFNHKFKTEKNFDAMRCYMDRDDFILKDSELLDYVDWENVLAPPEDMTDIEILPIFYQVRQTPSLFKHLQFHCF